MSAHQIQLEIHFAFPATLVCHAGATDPARRVPQFEFFILPHQFLHGDTIRNSLHFAFPANPNSMLVHQLQLEIHFVFLCKSNSSCSCWPASDWNLGERRSAENCAPTPARDTICVSLQFAFPSNSRFPPIRVPSNSDSSASSGGRTSTARDTICIPILVLHARAPDPARDTIHVSLQFAFPFNSSSSCCPTNSPTTFHSNSNSRSSPVPAREALPVSLRFQFEFFMLAHPNEIYFAVPPIRVLHVGAQPPPGDTIRVPLQFQFEFFIMPAH